MWCSAVFQSPGLRTLAARPPVSSACIAPRPHHLRGTIPPWRALRTHPRPHPHPPPTVTRPAPNSWIRRHPVWTTLAAGTLGGTALGTWAALRTLDAADDAMFRHEPVVERLRIAARAVVRSIMTFGTTAAITTDYKWLYFQHGHLGIASDEYARLRAQVHQRSANLLLWLCRNHGGIYNKAAQHVGSLVRMVPKEYTDTLSVLQDKAPFHPYEEVIEVFQREFGAFPSEFFLEFDETPMAAASLAQVHRAVTKDGHEVAVKVQYKDVQRNFRIDIWCMSALTRLVSTAFPEFQLAWVVKEFEENLTQEFDFRHEARNAERAQQRFANRNVDFHIPDIYWPLTTAHVLTMRMDVEYLQQSLIDVFADMIFVHGETHCDPHPGNMLVRQSPHDPNIPQLVLLDHGLYRTLSPSFRHTYCDLWVGILTSNDQLLESAGSRLGEGGAKYWRLFPLMFAGHARGSPTGTQLGDDLTPADRVHLKAALKGFSLEDAVDFLEGVPRDMLLVMRTMNFVSGVHRALGGRNLPKFRQQAWYAVVGRHAPLSRSVMAWIVGWIVDLPVVGSSAAAVAAAAAGLDADRGSAGSGSLVAWFREWMTVWWRLWVVIPVVQMWRAGQQRRVATVEVTEGAVEAPATAATA
ncbi:atypical/ABC1 protein kinase [Allomyces macrogynus ATCC 38327]|uniref:Atypical/ABC1 protein kinase n=1 Tax=Allomyces macrogynus (strain ATCC 38327) TaxID=578462 RepID=A0A0L0RVF9_ALLM3|nr:atypical/ABC1 protein kinase [Allomyces macrogynus ATCC 38327]|eukprot:KNE54298.1 atypical/ABC1 protein kinase [Allomyces macrogynus ATCC 38327]